MHRYLGIVAVLAVMATSASTAATMTATESAASMLALYAQPFVNRDSDRPMSSEVARMRPIAQSLTDRMRPAALVASLDRFGTPPVDDVAASADYDSLGTRLLAQMASQAFFQHCAGDQCGDTRCVQNLSRDDAVQRGDCLNFLYATYLTMPYASADRYFENGSAQSRALLFDPYVAFDISQNDLQAPVNVRIARHEGLAMWFARVVARSKTPDRAALFVYASASEPQTATLLALDPTPGPEHRSPSYALRLLGEYAPLYAFIQANPDAYSRPSMNAAKAFLGRECGALGRAGASAADVSAICS